MTSTLVTILMLICLGIAALACWRGKSLRGPKRVRYVKLGIGAVGSIAIILFVSLLSELLELLVIAICIGWLAWHLHAGRARWIRFLDKKIAKAG